MNNPLVKLTPHGYYRTLQAGDIRLFFGLKASSHLPNKFIHKTYSGPRGDVPLFIAPREYGLVNQKILRPHRIFAICPKCEREVPFGRFHQHWRRKDHA
jgi:hypothetical protein